MALAAAGDRARRGPVPIPPPPEPPWPVAISGCLLGQSIRYDGSHGRSSLPHELLDGLFDYRSICPEVGIGMSVPRPPIRLVRRRGESVVRALGVEDPTLDVTERLIGYADALAPAHAGIDGHVFMKGSPSCGFGSTKVRGEQGHVLERGQGLYAARVEANHPLLPCEDCGRLFDDVLRENFVTRVRAHAHWRALRAEGLSLARLASFHARYKYRLMAHSQSNLRTLGRLLADGGDVETLADRYAETFFATLARPPGRSGHANALQHLAGHLKRALDPPTRRELAETIASYRLGRLPLIVPVAFLEHLLRRFPDDYARAQIYLSPHPRTHGLFNRI